MGREVKLLHSVPKSQVGDVLRDGLEAASELEEPGLEMRRGVVFCRLCREHDRMWGRRPDYAYLEVSVDKDGCRVAEMDFAALSLRWARRTCPPCRPETRP